jgi:hypothetical protein
VPGSVQQAGQTRIARRPAGLTFPNMKPIEEILRQYAGEFRNCPAAVTIFDRLQHQKQNYGNPTFTSLKEPFDITWGAGDTKIALRWTWLDSSPIRKSHTDSDSLLACTLVWNHKEHLLLKEEDNPCLYGLIGPSTPRLKRRLNSWSSLIWTASRNPHSPETPTSS